MAVAWQSFYAELESNALAVWPEVKPVGKVGGGLWELNEIERASQLRIAFPYAVYEVVSSDAGDWGLANSAYEVKVEFHYIDREPSGNAGVPGLRAIRDKLDLLRARLLHVGNFTTATVLDVDLLDWSGHNPALSIFYQKNISFVSGAVAATFVIGETVS